MSDTGARTGLDRDALLVYRRDDGRWYIGVLLPRDGSYAMGFHVGRREQGYATRAAAVAALGAMARRHRYDSWENEALDWEGAGL